MTDELGGRAPCYVDVEDLLEQGIEMADHAEARYHIRQAAQLEISRQELDREGQR